MFLMVNELIVIRSNPLLTLLYAFIRLLWLVLIWTLLFSFHFCFSCRVPLVLVLAVIPFEMNQIFHTLALTNMNVAVMITPLPIKHCDDNNDAKHEILLFCVFFLLHSARHSFHFFSVLCEAYENCNCAQSNCTRKKWLTTIIASFNNTNISIFMLSLTQRIGYVGLIQLNVEYILFLKKILVKRVISLQKQNFLQPTSVWKKNLKTIYLNGFLNL